MIITKSKPITPSQTQKLLGMNACKIPCNDCPFRKDSIPGWLADYTPEELHRIVMNEMPFPCHMTHEEEVDWDEAGEEYPLCAGALRYMKKGAKSPRDKRLAAHVNQLTKNDCENILSIPEFFEHHKQFA